MKRIFLTSGLVLCMACPAFATGETPTGPVNGGTNECTIGVLGTATDEANVQLKAKWTPVYKTITLSGNYGATSLTGGDDEESLLAPTSLYFVAGTSTLYTGINSTTLQLEGASSTTSSDVISTDPTGIYVNFALQANVPDGSQETATMPTSTAVRRSLDGYYKGDTKYINANGTLTQAALDYAGNNNSDSDTWTAKWNEMHPSVTGGTNNDGKPTLSGYDFVGWATTANGTAMTDEQFVAYKIGVPGNNEAAKLYAKWSAKDITINFNCATAGDDPQPSGSYAFVAGTGATEGANATGSMTMKKDANGTLASTCTLQGWTFLGWSCTTNALSSDQAGTSKYADTDTIGTDQTVYMKSSSTVTCNAVWEQNTINLHWDVNGATSSTANGARTCDYDGNVGLPTQPSKTGYTFGGWEVVTPTPSQGNLVDTGTTPQL